MRKGRGANRICPISPNNTKIAPKNSQFPSLSGRKWKWFLLYSSPYVIHKKNRRKSKGSEMACRAVFRTTVFLTEPWPRPLPCNRITSFSLPSIPNHTNSSPIPSFNTRARDFHFARRTHHLNSAHNETASSSSEEDHDQGPPQEAVLKAISGSSRLCFLALFFYLKIIIIFCEYWFLTLNYHHI